MMFLKVGLLAMTSILTFHSRCPHPHLHHAYEHPSIERLPIVVIPVKTHDIRSQSKHELGCTYWLLFDSVVHLRGRWTVGLLHSDGITVPLILSDGLLGRLKPAFDDSEHYLRTI